MRWLAAVAVAGVLPLSAAWAADKGPQTPDDLDKGVSFIPWKDAEPFKGGKLAYVEGTSVDGGDVTFGLERLSVTQPVSVSVLAKQPAGRLRLTAVKWDKQAPGKQVETDRRGAASLSFRVQGDARLVVRGLGAKTAFQLMVWVGPDLKPPLPSPFVPGKPEQMRAGKGGTP
jgi:hypothetical protein